MNKVNKYKFGTPTESIHDLTLKKYTHIQTGKEIINLSHLSSRPNIM
jgi:hypothetical protein